MTIDHLQKLIKEGEGFTTEFKECTHALNNSVFETVCSFSNRYGGYLLLGVRDDSKVIGVNPASVDGIKKNFVNTLNNPQKVFPTLFLSLSQIEFDGKIVLYVYVPRSSHVEFCSGKVFDRNFEADVDITRSTDSVANLYSIKSGEFSERKVFPYAALDDMRLDLIPRVKQMALTYNSNHPWRDMSDMEFFRSAGLYEDDKMGGQKGFNLAGILLFGRDEVVRSCAAGAVTDCLMRRENLDRYDDRLIVETNLIEAYDQITEFIAKHTLDRFFLLDGHSISVRSHIAREIVSNSLAHREYTSSYRSRIIIEQDRIMADNWSRAQSLGPLDPENFTPRSKNPIIAKFFVNIGRADELGSGVRNLYKYTRIYTGGAEPELIEGDVFKTVVPLVSVKRLNKVQLDEIKCSDCTANCTLTELEILKFLNLYPEATQLQLAQAIGKSERTVKAATAHLQELELLRREGAKKNGRWVVTTPIEKE